jgi:hypothetical protein
VVTLLLFQKKFFRKLNEENIHPVVETGTEVNDKMQVS